MCSTHIKMVFQHEIEGSNVLALLVSRAHLTTGGIFGLD